MKYLMSYIKTLRRQLRVVLTSKRLVILISIGSMVGTLFFVKILKSFSMEDNDEFGVFFEHAMNGKKAVSILAKAAELPLELLYPGVKVDVIDRRDAGISYLVKDVYVLGISVIEAGTIAKVTLAVNNQESEKILQNQSKEISLLVRGEGSSSKNTNDIEIIEL